MYCEDLSLELACYTMYLSHQMGPNNWGLKLLDGNGERDQRKKAVVLVRDPLSHWLVTTMTPIAWSGVVMCSCECGGAKGPGHAHPEHGGGGEGRR